MASFTENVSVEVGAATSDITFDELFRLMNTIPASTQNVTVQIPLNVVIPSAFDFIPSKRFHPKDFLTGRDFDFRIDWKDHH